MSTTAVIAETSRAKLCVAVVAVATVSMLFIGPLSTQAGHIAGTHDCGPDQVLDVNGRGSLPAAFDGAHNLHADVERYGICGRALDVARRFHAVEPSYVGSRRASS